MSFDATASLWLGVLGLGPLVLDGVALLQYLGGPSSWERALTRNDQMGTLSNWEQHDIIWMPIAASLSGTPR